VRAARLSAYAVGLVLAAALGAGGGGWLALTLVDISDGDAKIGAFIVLPLAAVVGAFVGVLLTVGGAAILGASASSRRGETAPPDAGE
jgi:hypothetical protein